MRQKPKVWVLWVPRRPAKVTITQVLMFRRDYLEWNPSLDYRHF